MWLLGNPCVYRGNNMIHEYTYFQADGQAQAAVDAVNDAVAEYKSMRFAVMNDYQASGIVSGMDMHLQKYMITALTFNGVPPAGWQAVGRNVQGHTIAKPDKSSPDGFYLANMAGLMERAALRMQLENVFHCGDMPDKDLPAGTYTRAFIRRTSVDEGRALHGSILDSVTEVVQSDQPFRTTDPLDFKMIGGKHYIRVPNDATGQPVFTPPDAHKISFDALLKIEFDIINRDFNSFRGHAMGR